MLIELAEVSSWARAFSPSSPESAAKALFTPLWQSSKLPRTAQTVTFAPSWVTICARCTAETPPCGKNTKIRVPGTSWKPSSAALPVSPEVAVSTTVSLVLPLFSFAAATSCGSIESATSLKAAVGPRKSSRK